jgi:hypothetical protein
MTLFCPDGYVQVRAAIERAAQCWFPEQVAAIETALAGELVCDGKPNDGVNALTPNEQLGRALGGQPSISEGLRQQFENVFTQTEHRLRNFLHRDELSVFYFGTLFDRGRQTVTPGFWTGTEADGVLLSGTYWPLGQPRTRYEQKPAYPLFFLESELTALLSLSAADSVDIRKQARFERQSGSPVGFEMLRAFPTPSSSGNNGRKRGKKPVKLNRVIAEMTKELERGTYTLDALDSEKEELMASKYQASRDTCRKARIAVIRSRDLIPDK